MTIAPDEPDIKHLDFEPEAPKSVCTPEIFEWAKNVGPATYTYGDPTREPSVGLLGAHAVPEVGGIVSALYEALNEIHAQETVRRPEGMGLPDWLANCSPARGELLRTLQAADLSCTCHTWTTGDDA